MSRHTLTLDIDVFDPELLAAAAAKHAEASGISEEEWEAMRGSGIDPKPDAEGLYNCRINNDLIMLLDPGGGGNQWTGNLNEAGIQVEGSTAECVDE